LGWKPDLDRTTKTASISGKTVLHGKAVRKIPQLFFIPSKKITQIYFLVVFLTYNVNVRKCFTDFSFIIPNEKRFPLVNEFT